MTAGAILAAGALTAIAPAAEAATYPVKPFYIKYGNTYTSGHVTFYNRSVLVEGVNKSVYNGDCRYIRAITFDKIELHQTGYSAEACDESAGFSMTLEASNKGGAVFVRVELLAGCCGHNSGKALGRVDVYK